MGFLLLNPRTMSRQLLGCDYLHVGLNGSEQTGNLDGIVLPKKPQAWSKVYDYSPPKIILGPQT